MSSKFPTYTTANFMCVFQFKQINNEIYELCERLI